MPYSIAAEDELIRKLKDRQVDPRTCIDYPEAFTHRVYPPVTPAELQLAERVLGFRLPGLLARVYAEVGNGGFGPDYGILALNEHGASNFSLPLVGWYQEAISFSEPGHPRWPRQCVTVCDWGDGLTSILDCSEPRAPILRFHGDCYEGGPFEQVIVPESSTLQEWLADWVAGLSLCDRGRPNSTSGPEASV